MNARLIAAAAAAALLAGCGSNTDSAPPQQTPSVAMAAISGASADQVSHAETVAQLYMAYFMRPADPYGELHFAQQLATLGIPNDIHKLNQAYQVNPAVRALVNSFSSSTESMAVHGAQDNAADDVFVNRIYNNLLGRDADLEGLKFWVGAIRDGQLTRAGASLMIASAAQTNQSAQGLLDGALIRNRIRFSTLATAELSRLQLVTYYVGLNSAAIGRRWLATVNADDTPETIARKVAGFIKEVKGEVVICDPGPCNVTG